MVTRLETLTHGSAACATRLQCDARLVRAWAIPLMGFLVSSCPASAQRPSFDSLPPGTSVAVRPLSGDDQMLRVLFLDVPGFATERVRQVIRDQPQWEAFWSRARVSSNRRVAPPVDFDRDIVIVAGNSRSLVGPDIAILGAVARADSLYVLVRSRIGVSPGCHNDAYEHPMAIALVPRSNGPVVFVETERNEWCGHPPPS
jgi:hypothetical protein